MAEVDLQRSLRELLALAAEIEETLPVEGSGSDPRVRRQERSVLRRRLVEALSADRPRPRFLRELQSGHGLDDGHLVLVLILLASRIRRGVSFLSGRSLMETVAEDPYDMIAKGGLLDASSPLLEAGILRFRSLMTDSHLEAEYRIAEWVFHGVAREISTGSAVPAAPTPEGGEEPPPDPYPSATAHLLEMRQLVDLYQMRAAGLFADSGWRSVYPETDGIVPDLSELILEIRATIRERERQSEPSLKLPLVELRREFGLEDEEEIMILALLFTELFNGPALMDPGELVRLVSGSEDEVFRRRKLLSAGSTLRENGLIVVDTEIEGKDFLGEVHVAEWVSERLLAGVEDASAINDDDCRTFHRYLQRLRDSDDFYRRL